jgi:hypothetical protein
MKRNSVRSVPWGEGGFLQDTVNELVTNSKKKIGDLYRGVNEFKRGYQLRNKLVKEENGDLLAHSDSILNRWENYVSHLLNVHKVSNVRQIEVHRLNHQYLVPAILKLKLLLQS